MARDAGLSMIELANPKSRRNRWPNNLLWKERQPPRPEALPDSDPVVEAALYVTCFRPAPAAPCAQ